jgi:hypothetical protein
MQQDEESFKSACTMLSSIASRGGREAGVGLLAYHRELPERLETVVSALSSFPTSATVEALAAELYRVESTMATRRYLNSVLDALTRLPRELWESKLIDMVRTLTSARGGAGSSTRRWRSGNCPGRG